MRGRRQPTLSEEHNGNIRSLPLSTATNGTPEKPKEMGHPIDQINGHDHPPETVAVNGKVTGAHHDHDHDHDHDHGMFHVHETPGNREGVEMLRAALRGEGGPGSNVTLWGAASNVFLSLGKGVTGVMFNSQALIADGVHSLGDLLGDLVVFFTWNWSKASPTADWPFGFGKIESLGTIVISCLLIGGAFTLGWQSLTLLAASAGPWLHTAVAPGAVAVLEPIAQSAKAVIEAAPDTHVLDPNAAWIAAFSIVVKEFMYRWTKRVADEEGSSVLAANAMHHRSDSLSSAIALVAILGSWGGLPWADPLGGAFVSFYIGFQGSRWLWGATLDLLDKGVKAEERELLARLLSPLPAAKGTPTEQLMAIRNVRAVKSGSQFFVDLTADVPSQMTMREAHALEGCIRETLTQQSKKNIKEVRVHLHAEGEEDLVKNKIDDRKTKSGNGPC